MKQNIKIARELVRIAKELMATTIKQQKDGIYVNNVKAVQAVIIRERRRAKRACWRGKPWQVALVLWGLGCAINNGDKWYVELTLENKRKVTVTLDEFLKGTK